MKTNFETSDIVTLNQARPALRALRQSGANAFARAQNILAGINQLNAKSAGMITTVRGMQCRITKVLLLRLNFFGGQHEKREFFDRVGAPVATYVHRKRMSFHPPGTLNPSGKPMQGDSIEYAHFVWQAGIKPKWTMLRVIGTESQPKLVAAPRESAAIQPQLIT